MLLAAVRALAKMSPSKRDAKANLLPPVTELRHVSYGVAVAVALQAQSEGLAEQTSREELEACIRLKMWTPVYRPYRRIADQEPTPVTERLFFQMVKANLLIMPNFDVFP